MRTDLGSLAAAMAAPDINAASRVTTEPHLPRWAKITSGTGPQNPLGHDALYINGRLLRARSGSLASPNDRRALLRLHHRPGRPGGVGEPVGASPRRDGRPTGIQVLAQSRPNSHYRRRQRPGAHLLLHQLNETTKVFRHPVGATLAVALLGRAHLCRTTGAGKARPYVPELKCGLIWM
jgi:hypothetical protein